MYAFVVIMTRGDKTVEPKRRRVSGALPRALIRVPGRLLRLWPNLALAGHACHRH